MKKNSDYEIQSLVEDIKSKASQDLNHDELEDFVLYQQLFEVLAAKPISNLSSDFSHKVSRKIESKQNRLQNFVLIFLIGLLTLLGTVFIINTTLFQDLVVVFFKFKWTIIFYFFAFISIQYFDHKFVKVIL